MRWRGATIALLSILTLGCAERVEPEVILVDTMQLQLGSSLLPPSADSDSLVTVSMPDFWPRQRRAIAIEGWYRATLEIDASLVPGTDDSIAIYLPFHTGLLSIYWDGNLLNTTLPSLGSGVPKAGGPILQVVPTQLSGQGQHVLHLHLRGSASMPDAIRTPVIGRRSDLQSVYLMRRTFARDLPLALAVASILAGILLAAAYRRDPTGPGATWLAVALISFSVSRIGFYVPFPGLPEAFADALRPALFHWAAVAFAITLHRMRGLDRRRFERILLALWTMFTVAIFATSPLDNYAVAIAWSPLTWSLGLYCAIQFVRHTWAAPAHRALSLAITLCLVGFSVHDFHGAFGGGRYLAGQLLLIYLGPIIALATLGLMVGRARRHLDSTLRMNRELETRVAEKHAELERNYAELADAQRREAAGAERQRLLRDMHDGLGGQLVSTLAMVESGRFDAEELTAALRDSLDDLRLLVQSTDSIDSADLTSTLAVIRERLEPRFSRQDIRFDWRIGDLPPLALEPEGLPNVVRIVQEALTNILKHADAHTITFAAETTSTSVVLSIRDDGRGPNGNGERGSGPGGHGLGNMRERAKELNGSVDVRACADGPGTVVELRLPLELATRDETEAAATDNCD